MDYKINAVTEICDAQANFTRVSIASFIEHNPWFDGTIFLLTVPKLTLSSSIIDSIQRVYQNVSLINTGEEDEILNALGGGRLFISEEDRVRAAYFNIFKTDLNRFVYFSNRSLFLGSIDSFLNRDQMTIDRSTRVFYYSSDSPISQTQFYPQIKNEILSSKANLFTPKNIENIIQKVLSKESTTVSDPTIDCSLNYKNSELLKLKSFTKVARCITYNTFSSNSLYYSSINSLWLAYHKKVSQHLNSARSFLPKNDIKAVTLSQEKTQSPAGSEGIIHKLAVLIHCYYYDVMPELKKYVDRLPSDSDIFINIPEPIRDDSQVQKVAELFPNAKIQFSENRGRDVGGFVSLWSNHGSKEYTSVLLLHTKKSPHIKHGSVWRQNLLNAILGDSRSAATHATSIYPGSNLGIIGSRQHRNTSSGKNLGHLANLNSLFSIPRSLSIVDYVSGTIMFISPEILDLLCSKIKHSDFTDGTGKGLNHHMDGQLEHAIERFFATLCRKLGKTIKYV